MKLLFKTLISQRQPYKGFFIFFLLSAVAVAIAEVIATRMTGEMGLAAYNQELDVLLHFLLVITGIMLIQAIAAAASALFLGRFAAKAGYRFRDNFAKFFLRRPFSKFEGVNSGESLSIYANDLPAAVELVTNGGLAMLADMLTLVVTFVYMLTLNTSLTLIFFASFPVLIALQIGISIPVQKAQVRRSEARAALTAVVNDSLQNTLTIAAYSLEEVVQKRCENSYATVISTTKSYIRTMMPLVMGGILMSLSPLLIVTGIAANMAINPEHHLNLAEFIAFLGLASNAGGFLGMLSQRQATVQTSAAGAQRLLEAMDGDVEELTPCVNGLVATNGVAISAKDLSFAYPSASEEESKNVLDNVSFEIKKGSKVAFVGGSGSGKSTILKLLLGLYPATDGELNVWGQNVSDIPLTDLREAFAYVPQDSFLFPESILANITGETKITDEARLTKACQDAGILDFIQNLPDKFDSVLNESAENVSGGQKQRIALARAFYRNSSIILFDEATSALDPATEAEIFKSLATISSDKTVIMVAHRTKAIDFCDSVITMENGRIKEVQS